MAPNYSTLKMKESLGGPDSDYEDDFIFSQSQHVLADEKKFYVSMMLKNNFRIVDMENNKTVTDPDFSFDVSMPAGMDFLGDNELIVADLNDDKIFVCNRADGSFVRVFKSGLDKPNDIATNGKDTIFVGEVGENGKKVTCYDSNGNEKFKIDSANGKTFTGVNYLSYDSSSDRLIITDTDDNSVHVFQADGSYEFSLTATGSDPGQLRSPQGTVIDRFGNILICDQANNRVQVFDKSGQFVSIFGEGDVFSYPFDICAKSNEIVVLDGSIFSGWSRLQIFQY